MPPLTVRINTYRRGFLGPLFHPYESPSVTGKEYVAVFFPATHGVCDAMPYYRDVRKSMASLYSIYILKFWLRFCENQKPHFFSSLFIPTGFPTNLRYGDIAISAGL